MDQKTLQMSIDIAQVRVTLTRIRNPPREFEWFINFSPLTSQNDLRSKMQDQYSSGVVTGKLKPTVEKFKTLLVLMSTKLYGKRCDYTKLRKENERVAMIQCHSISSWKLSHSVEKFKHVETDVLKLT